MNHSLSIGKRFSLALVFASMLGAAASASAHMVWVERDGAAPVARAYFGEWAEDVREKAGGYLDLIKAPQAYGTDAAKPYTVTRKDDHIEIAAATGDVRVVEAMASRDDKKQGGKSRSVFNAKAGRAETAAKLDLELVPAAPNSNTFVLTFKGKPVPKTEVTVFGPPKWSQSFHTDEQGRITISTPWQGRYVLETTYHDATAGEAPNGAFDRTRYVGTLSFEVAEGLPWAAK